MNLNTLNYGMPKLWLPPKLIDKRKLLMRVKLVIIVMISCFMQVSASTYAQRVTLAEKHVSLEVLFNKIGQQTGYDFLFNAQLINTAKTVDVDLKNVTIEEALDRCLKGQDLEYTINNKSVIVKKKTPSFLDKVAAAFNNIDVRGRVTDSAGVALKGATIRVKGSATKSQQTDKDGNFYISQVPQDGTLIISYLGYITREVKVSQRFLQIGLKLDNKILNEVTVTNGYQNFDRRNLTSAITTIKVEDILVPGMFTIDQALEGRVPGLFVMNNSGEVGAAPKIRIRGTSTVLGNQEPVWVVDGVVVNDPVRIDPATINDLDFVNRIGNAISGLNPYDIEQIDVLKDASATALYGVKAANGVIVITTKKGHNGPPEIHFSTAGTITRRPRYSDGNINMMNSLQRTDLSREVIDKKLNYPALINYVGYEGAVQSLYNGEISYDAFQQQVHKLETANTDWFGLITQDALSVQNNLSISGGNQKMKYFASFGAQNEQGTVRGNQVSQYTALVKLNTNLTDKLNWDINLRANMGKRDYAAANVDALNYAYNTNRAIFAYNDDGSPYYYKKFTSFNYYNFNVLNEIDNSRDLSNSLGVNLINTLSYRFSNELKGSAIFSYGTTTTDQEISYAENTFYASGLRMSEYGATPAAYGTLLPFGGELRSKNDKNYNYLARTQFDYNKTFGDSEKHLLNASIGGELSSNQYGGSSIIRRGYLPDRGKTFAAVDPTKYVSYASWALNNTDVLTDQLTNLLSGYFTTSYTYNQRYTINFNTRTDYSNKFGSRSNEKFLPTWSLSGRWNAADDFFKDSKTVNQLSLRLSYGAQGNMPDFQTPELIIQRGGLDPVSGEYISTIKYSPNPNLQWEKTTQINSAIDFSLFNNKLVGSLSYYYKKTKDVFVDKALTDINGWDSYIVNSGTLVNKGLEIALSFTPINTSLSGGKRFIWRVDPQIGQALNSLLSKKSQNVATASANTYTNYLDGTAILDGRDINTFYSYQFNGLSAVNGMPTFKNDANTAANLAYIKTLTKDQLLQYVLVPSGSRTPTLQGGLSNYFAYKNFSLSFNLSYSFGSKIRKFQLYDNLSGNARAYNTSVPLPEQNVSTELMNRWRNPGDELFTDIPAFLKGADYNNTNSHWTYGQSYNYAYNIWQMYDNSDLRVVSGDFVKLKSLSFRYMVPPQICKKAGLKNASLNISGSNLYTFASKSLNGQDPEQAGFTNSIQVSSRPTFSFGLDVSF